MLKVAIIGPESTGKSELAIKLANHYQGVFVPEYAREYVEKLDRPYVFDDVCKIAQFQIEQENFFAEQKQPDFVFFDTELIITKVWLTYLYNQCPGFVNEELNKGFFDLYLLCATDLPWEPDPVREHGTDREFFFQWYQNEIVKLGKPYFIVDGTGEDRTFNAIGIIDRFIK